MVWDRWAAWLAILLGCVLGMPCTSVDASLGTCPKQQDVPAIALLQSMQQQSELIQKVKAAKDHITELTRAMKKNSSGARWCENP